jgi:DNA polymerase elongation subunit (family B)
MYRNAFYNSRNGSIFLRTWSEDGARIDTEIPFRPFLYTETTKDADATSIFRTSLRKKYFRNSAERNNFVKETSNTRLFGNLSCEQQFLIETFKDDVDDKDFSKHPLKVYFLDIETFSPNEFPVPEQAKDPVILLTLHNNLTDEIHTWGVEKSYTPKKRNVTYYKCKDEFEMFERFINFWKADPPDIVAGWNSERFDIPYIINRARKLFNDDFINQISPVNKMYYRTFMDDFGKNTGKYIIYGLSCLDYMEIYKAYSKGERESYSLNYIGEYELKEGKLAINATNLSSLAENDWDNFVDYNIQDVELLVKLEKKLNYLRIVRLLAYKGCTNFEAALGKVAIVTGAMAIQAYKHGYVIPTFKNETIRDSLVGGYVREPERGLKKSIVSYDVNSLYPNTIITLNISAETKVGKIVTGEYGESEKLVLRLVNGKTHELTDKQFKAFIKKEKLAVSKAGILYSQKFKGVCPSLIDKLYAERVAAKNELEKLELLKKKTPENIASIEYLDTLQYTIKILLNSIYGTFANKHSAFMDIDNASSITMTGQAVAKSGARILDEYIENNFNINKSCVVAGDTDSVYISIQPVLDKLKLKLLNEELVVDEKVHSIVDGLTKQVNTQINIWAKNDLNSLDPRFEFKREVIADVGVFLQKKRYIVRVVHKESIPVPGGKFKYVGVEIARSTMPKMVKELVKEVMENALLTNDNKHTSTLYRDIYQKFISLPITEVSFRSSVQNYQKYSEGATLSRFNKSTPCHVKASIAHNLLLDELKLTSKYEKIQSGQKVKYFYTSKNPYKLDAIAFITDYPKEFNSIKIDYEKMFLKIVAPPIERLYNALNWRLPQIGKEVQTDLFDLFGCED